MADPRCVGEGAGWGTVDGVRLRVLLLAAEDRTDVARAIARALSARHEPTIVEHKGFMASFRAARAAREFAPHLIHAVGARGAAKAGAVVALGAKVPLVISANAADARATEALDVAAAVLLDEGATADQLRAQGVDRDLYILSPPDSEEEDDAFLGALEVVYGRVLSGADVELEQEEQQAQPAAPKSEQLVHIGRRKA